jgi:hypothetical protein
MTKIEKKTGNVSHKKGPGNNTEAPIDHKDPTGSEETISHPGNSGYDEKQPAKQK